jgi:hypothetical protein
MILVRSFEIQPGPAWPGFFLFASPQSVRARPRQIVFAAKDRKTIQVESSYEQMGAHTITFKEWAGSGTPDVTVEWLASQGGDRPTAGGGFKLKITRRSDNRSSRLGMMAELNKRNNTLAWGFTQITQIFEHPSIDNNRLLLRTITVYTSVAVADYRPLGTNEEEITFIANKRSEYAIPIGVVGP